SPPPGWRRRRSPASGRRSAMVLASIGRGSGRFSCSFAGASATESAAEAEHLRSAPRSRGKMSFVNHYTSENDASQDFAGPGIDDPGPPERSVSPVDIIVLVLVSARRRALLGSVLFLLGVGAVIGYLVMSTPKYRVETMVLTQRAQALPSPIRSTVQDDPTRSVNEVIHRRENLLALIQQTNLYSPESGSR